MKQKDEQTRIESSEFLREVGRMIAGGFYDYQEVRIGLMNRIRDIVRKKNENIPFDAVEEKKEEAEYNEKYKDENLSAVLNKLVEDKKLNLDEQRYAAAIFDLIKESVKNEAKYKKLMDDYIATEPIFYEFLDHIRGISTILSANLIKNFGYCDAVYGNDVLNDREEVIHKKGDDMCPHISSLWKMCGLHVVNGRAVKREKGVKQDYNPKMRTLCWKIGDSFVKQRTPYYRDVYDAEKARLQKIGPIEANFSPWIKGDLLGEDVGKFKVEKRITKEIYLKLEKLFKQGDMIKIILAPGHIDNRARRKTVKIFLAHYWLKARQLKGLPISNPYVIDKLGHRDFVSPDEIIAMSKKKAQGL